MEVKKRKPNTKKPAKDNQSQSINGKGDAPRHLSTKFRSNYEKINWKKS